VFLLFLIWSISVNKNPKKLSKKKESKLTLKHHSKPSEKSEHEKELMIKKENN
jgi:hypothetical protein